MNLRMAKVKMHTDHCVIYETIWLEAIVAPKIVGPRVLSKVRRAVW